MSRVIHLNKSGRGMASMTACGRNILRTPLSTNWEGYKETPKEQRCAKCEASKQAEVNRKSDARKEAEEAAKWEPVEDPNAWMAADAALIAAKRNK